MVVASVALAGCDRAPAKGVGALSVEVLPGPTAAPGKFPRFAAGSSLALTWVEEPSKTAAELQFSKRGDSGWTAPVRIAAGERWFVNWADFPALALLDDQRGIAHFLERSAEGTYDYNVQFARTEDGGRTWSEPARLHSDPGPGEHGFVSLVALDSENCAAVWLDGRSTRENKDATGHGAMSLYTRNVRFDGALGEELLLDERVCDCCPTAAVRASNGALLVAYRDRSMDEVRDVNIVRVAPGGVAVQIWASGDGWKIPGCPVNGPALAVSGERIAVAWFTLGDDGVARVLCALSEDSGRSFSAAITLAQGDTQGRVDAVFDGDGRLIVSWLEGDGDVGQWRVARVDRGGTVLDENPIVEASSARSSGMARLSVEGRGALFAFTEVTADGPRVGVRRLTWD